MSGPRVWPRRILEQELERLREWEREHLIPGAEGAICGDCGDFLPAGADCENHGDGKA